MAPIRVLVVDDSVVIRKVLCEALASDPEIEIAGSAPDGSIALSKIGLLKPDVVTLDVEMPVMSGIETLTEIRKINPTLPVIMFSTLTERGATTTLDALALGASDYLTKPHGTGSLEETRIRIQRELIPKVKALCQRTRATPEKTPIVIVQHMPPLFTKLLADRLQKQSAIRIREGQPGAVLNAGEAWIAPGDFHMTVRREEKAVKLAMNQEAPENSCRPAVDVLFRSAARVYGPHALGVVLTGMGSDGTLGAKQKKSAGAQILVQDEATSVVWGMPGTVVAAGLADGIFALEEIAGELGRRVWMFRTKDERKESAKQKPVRAGTEHERTAVSALSAARERQ